MRERRNATVNCGFYMRNTELTRPKHTWKSISLTYETSFMINVTCAEHPQISLSNMREGRRLTTRCVASTHSAVLFTGYPHQVLARGVPHPVLTGGHPIQSYLGDTPSSLGQEYPHPGLARRGTSIHS